MKVNIVVERLAKIYYIKAGFKTIKDITDFPKSKLSFWKDPECEDTREKVLEIVTRFAEERELPDDGKELKRLKRVIESKHENEAIVEAIKWLHENYSNIDDITINYSTLAPKKVEPINQ